MSRFSNILKNIFFLLLIIQVAPFLIMGIKKQYKNLLEPQTQVGVISCKGTIDNAGFYVTHLQKFFKDNDIKAILLKIDSGGGTAGTAQTIFNEIKDLKKDHPKPIITLVENACASGAYYIACATDFIIAPASAFMGSVGVYIAHPNFKDCIEQFKIHYTVTQSGKYKTVGDPLLAMPEDGKELLQQLTDDTHDQFIQDVMESRHLVAGQSSAWKDGQILTGRQALTIGLIDALGSPEAAEKTIKERACITNEIEWIKPQKPSLLATLFGADNDDDQSYVESALGYMYSWLCGKVQTTML